MLNEWLPAGTSVASVWCQQVWDRRAPGPGSQHGHHVTTWYGPVLTTNQCFTIKINFVLFGPGAM